MYVSLNQALKNMNLVMVELYSVNAMFGLSYLQNQKLNLIQRVVFFKIVWKICQEQKMNFIQKILKFCGLSTDDKGLSVYLLKPPIVWRNIEQKRSNVFSIAFYTPYHTICRLTDIPEYFIQYKLSKSSQRRPSHFPLVSYLKKGFKHICFFTLQFIWGYFIRNCSIAFPNDIYSVFR